MNKIKSKSKVKTSLKIVSVFVVALMGAALVIEIPSRAQFGNKIFVVERNTTKAQVMKKLEEQGIIKNQYAFTLLYALMSGLKHIEPGGYEVSPDANTWEVIKILRKPPSLRWVDIPEGSRKEEIAEIITKELNWSEDTQKEFLSAYIVLGDIAREGTYLPDSHLLPVREGGVAVAKRIIDRFNEAFAEYYPKLLKENIKNDTALKIASLVQREAAGKEDMPLVAGIIWNRLNRSMRLEIDATVQYAKGKTEKGWWAPIKSEDRKIDSAFNTYKYKGLPPHPIANPSLDAIEAVIHPTKTGCLYYIHDINKQIHCARTFTEHRRNIEKYLKI